jgi:rhodanese-related sulfurtransferase
MGMVEAEVLVVENVSLEDFVDAVVVGDCTVVDVRDRVEFTSGHVPGAIHVPLHVVPLRYSEFASARELYVICETGARAFQAAQFLAMKGIDASNVEGGMVAWRTAGLAVAKGE